MAEKTKNNWKAELFSWIKVVVAAFLIALFINNFLIVNATVPTGSMENTIMTGSRVICSRLSYIGGDPQRYDIVVFRFNQNGKKEKYIKRIVGLPGETVEIIGGKVYIDGAESPLTDNFTPEVPEGDYGPFQVPENTYFMLGDNRNNSLDSKGWAYPYVPREDILGKAFFTYYPSFKRIDNT